jgi:hypothetical protein
MDAARLFTLLALLAPAQTAANRRCVSKPLGNFIPPFLLRAGPYFSLAAIDTVKWAVDVIIAIDNPAHRNYCSAPTKPHSPAVRALDAVAAPADWRSRKLAALLFSVGFKLGALLFAAFHFHWRVR